jgi:tetrahydromethanopterin S-methyltransferase subunit A
VEVVDLIDVEVEQTIQMVVMEVVEKVDMDQDQVLPLNQQDSLEQLTLVVAEVRVKMHHHNRMVELAVLV